MEFKKKGIILGNTLNQLPYCIPFAMLWRLHPPCQDNSLAVLPLNVSFMPTIKLKVAAGVKCFQTFYFDHILENVLFYSLLSLNLIPVNLVPLSNVYLPRKAEASKMFYFSLVWLVSTFIGEVSVSYSILWRYVWCMAVFVFKSLKHLEYYCLEGSRNFSAS